MVFCLLLSVSVCVCHKQVFWDYYSDPQVYDVRQVFTGTQQAWQSAVDSMVNGWVRISAAYEAG